MVFHFTQPARGSRRFLLWLCWVLLAGELSAADDAPPAAAAAPPIRRHALLVGCTKYDHYPEQSLEGPVNDVGLMRKTLVDRCAFRPDDIRALSEASDAHGRPTRANIAAGFQWLAQSVRRGDQVVILLAGHGSQQPDDHRDPGRDLEPDGLDETFLPCDVEHWDGDKVTGAIIDDELGAWTRAIAVQGVFVWIIFDSCHSGTALRGDSPFVLRRLEPNRLQVPQGASQGALPGTGVRGSIGSKATLPVIQGSLEGIDEALQVVALYAAQPFETEKECLLPPDSEQQQWQGLLSYAVCQILQQGSPPTYRELQQRILAQYRQWGWFEPTPLIEGVQLDRVVLDEQARPARYQLTGDRQTGWKIAGGRLHGLTENSILAVYPALADAQGGGAEHVVAYVRVVSSHVAQSVVEPCAYRELAAAKDLPANGLCRAIYTDLGNLKLRLAVDTQGHEQDAELAQFAQRLKTLSAADDALFQMTPNLSRAHWALQLRDGRYWLLPADLATMLDPLPWDATRFEVAPQIADARLREALDRAARVHNLLAVAQPFAAHEATSAGARAEFAVQFEMLRLRDKNDRQGEPLAAERGIILRPGDWVAWRIANRGSAAADVTLLFIDSELAIVPLFPPANTIAVNRLQADSVFVTAPSRVTAKTLGREQVVAIAVKADGPPRDFLFLSQSGLAHSLAVRGGSSDSALARLLKFANYRVGTTRGVDRDTLEAYSVQFIAWSVEDSNRPK